MLLIHLTLSIVPGTHCSVIPKLQEENVVESPRSPVVPA